MIEGIRISSLVILFSVVISQAYGQIDELVQTVRGKVVDEYTQQPLRGAAVVLWQEENRLKGTTTDKNGRYEFRRIPIGRYRIDVQRADYDTKFVDEILVETGKQAVITVEIEPTVRKVGEISLEDKSQFRAPYHDMALVAARSITPNDLHYFPGSAFDAQRVASFLPGVAPSPAVLGNHIAVRGMPSTGALYRVEGLDIVPPNNLRTLNGQGGFFSMLNPYSVSHMDFISHAFPAEYSNTNAAVYDLNLRDGNDESYEVVGDINTVGAGFSAEGPLGSSGGPSFLINGRYSTLQFLAPSLDYREEPTFFDGNFKLTLPTDSAGTFSLFGLFNSGENKIEAKDSADWENDYDRYSISDQSSLYVVGLKHSILLGSKMNLQNTIGFSQSTIANTTDFRLDDGSDQTILDNSLQETRITYHGKLLRAFSSKFAITTGLIVNSESATAEDDSLVFALDIDDPTATSFSNTSLSAQYYAQASYKFNTKFRITPGIHILYHDKTDLSIQPRLSGLYNLNDDVQIGFGYAWTAQPERTINYRDYTVTDNSGNSMMFTKDNLPSSHMVNVMGNYKLTEHQRIQVEIFGSYLFDQGGVDIFQYQPDQLFLFNPGTTSINAGSPDSNDVNNVSLTSTAINAGAEISYERSYSKGYHYMANATVFQSLVDHPGEGLLPSRLNQTFIIQAFGGKEFKIKRKNNIVVGGNVGLIASGGQYISENQNPVDFSFDGRKAKQLDANINASATLYFRWSKPKVAHFFSLQVLNAISQQPVLVRYNDNTTNQLEDRVGNGLLPIVSYRVEFSQKKR